MKREGKERREEGMKDQKKKKPSHNADADDYTHMHTHPLIKG